MRRAPYDAPKLAAAIPHVLVRPMATNDRPHAHHPTISSSFGPLCPPNHHPPPPAWRAHKPTERVLHARNANVTLQIRNLGMTTRRTSYRAPKSTCALFVSDILPDGSKRQPPAATASAHVRFSTQSIVEPPPSFSAKAAALIIL